MGDEERSAGRFTHGKSQAFTHPYRPPQHLVCYQAGLRAHEPIPMTGIATIAFPYRRYSGAIDGC